MVLIHKGHNDYENISLYQIARHGLIVLIASSILILSLIFIAINPKQTQCQITNLEYENCTQSFSSDIVYKLNIYSNFNNITRKICGVQNIDGVCLNRSEPIVTLNTVCYPILASKNYLVSSYIDVWLANDQIYIENPHPILLSTSYWVFAVSNTRYSQSG